MPTPNTLGHEMSLGLRLTEARQHIAYWKRQHELRPNPEAKAEAGARLLAWQGTAAAIESEIENLQSVR